MGEPAQDTRSSDLLAVPAEQRDLAWLRRSLQLAVELELATLPPYLCGGWSCTEESVGIAPLTIRNVAREEMAHLGLAANLLTAVGGTPAINTAAPVYPGPLPWGVRPDVHVYLRGLTKDYIADVYMPIEHPDSGPLTAPPPGPTIGQIYDAIDAAFARLNPPITGRNQHTAQLASARVFEITDLADARKAIGVMKDEGEGTATMPGDLPPSFGNPHYYRFAEIHNGATLEQIDGVWGFTGEPVEFPEVLPMAVVPRGGWPSPTAEVAALLRRFNDTYTSLLDDMQAAWETGAREALDSAVGHMFVLGEPAVALMGIPLPDGRGNYGPEFIYRP